MCRKYWQLFRVAAPSNRVEALLIPSHLEAGRRAEAAATFHANTFPSTKHSSHFLFFNKYSEFSADVVFDTRPLGIYLIHAACYFLFLSTVTAITPGCCQVLQPETPTLVGLCVLTSDGQN